MSEIQNSNASVVLGRSIYSASLDDVSVNLKTRQIDAIDNYFEDLDAKMEDYSRKIYCTVLDERNGQ